MMTNQLKPGKLNEQIVLLERLFKNIIDHSVSSDSFNNNITKIKIMTFEIIKSLMNTNSKHDDAKNSVLKLTELNSEKIKYEDMQKAMLNILEDFAEEKNNIASSNELLQTEIAERKKLESQLENSFKELESFSYSVSHDLRAPLRHIAGFVDLLAKKTSTSSDDSAKRYMGIIGSSVKRMGNLIDELLEFSRLGKTEIRYQKIDLNKIFIESMEDLQSEITERKISIIKDELPLVNADPILIRQVFNNLLSNSVKYTRGKDSVVIKVSHTLKNDNYHLISVSDNGVGFDNKYVDKLFGVFQRLHSDNEFEGNGIGLANVKRIISKHGGNVWAEGKLNEGASFYFTLKN